MKKLDLLSKLQTTFGVTKSELLFVVLIICGLAVGTGIKFFGGSDIKRNKQGQDIYRILDSLAEINKTTYTGSDIKGKPNPELVKGDTLVKRDNLYPESSKKEITKVKININDATVNDLMKLPGVGEKTAQMIYDYRRMHKFTKPEDLLNIKGIGKKKYEKLKDLILVN